VVNLTMHQLLNEIVEAYLFFAGLLEAFGQMRRLHFENMASQKIPMKESHDS
jgi:hypothetical protein